jgi:hypothetical protein
MKNVTSDNSHVRQKYDRKQAIKTVCTFAIRKKTNELFLSLCQKLQTKANGKILCIFVVFGVEGEYLCWHFLRSLLTNHPLSVRGGALELFELFIRIICPNSLFESKVDSVA